MNTLAFDTCFAACSVAATWRTPAGTGSSHLCELLERGHAERLLPMIEEVMRAAPFDFSQIERIVVTTGPGTFTGQRVGIAAARALSLATNAAVFTLSSLAVMAATAAAALGAELDVDELIVAVDARRGELYVQRFSGVPFAARSAPELATPASVVAALGRDRVLAVGSGAAVLQDAARERGVLLAAALPNLQPDVRHIDLTTIVEGAGPPRPLYLRPPDAKPQDGKAIERRA